MPECPTTHVMPGGIVPFIFANERASCQRSLCAQVFGSYKPESNPSVTLFLSVSLFFSKYDTVF